MAKNITSKKTYESISTDEEKSSSVRIIKSILCKSLQDEDYKTALQAQKELNSLLGLYQQPEQAVAVNNDLQKTLNLIEDYIYPLNLADDRYPIEEHVRRAAEKIRQQAAI